MTAVINEILLLTVADAPPDSYPAIYCQEMVNAIDLNCHVTTFAVGKKNIENMPSDLAPDCVKVVCEQAIAASKPPGSDRKIKVVVAFLASPIIVLCAGKIAGQLQAELVTITADTMETMVAQNQALEPFRAHLIDEYNKLIGQSARCAAITSSGYDHIVSQLHRPCQLLPLPLELDLQPHLQSEPQAEFDLELPSELFQLTCFTPAEVSQATFEKFFRALNRLAQSPALAKISLNVIGALKALAVQDLPGATQSLEIIRLGRLSAKYTELNLARADLVYICAPLDKKLTAAQEFLVRSQQVSALKSNRHILFHGAAEFCLQEIFESNVATCVSDIGDDYIEHVLTGLLKRSAAPLEKRQLTVDSAASISEQRMLIWQSLLMAPA